MTVGVLVLAAGRSRRFGSDKRQALLPDGRRVLDTLLEKINESGLPVLLCLDESDDDLAFEMDGRNIPYYRCHRAGEGMGATLAEGVAHIPSWDGLLVTLADMPWVRPSTYTAMALRLKPEIICVPAHNGRRGHPVGFGKRFFRELAELSGDSGARDLLTKHRDKVREIPLEDPAIQRDIDIPEDISSSSVDINDRG
jgi:molybdenum cofactor cytidylyltransferase